MNIIRKYGLLIGGLGFSTLGNWIYLIALNLSVWHLTHSPAAVAGVYIVGPVARILSNLIAGAIIDRNSKKRIMISVDIIRGVIVFLMPFSTSIWVIYCLIFLVNIAGSFFGPSSTYTITKLVADHDKQRFNALLSTINSGSFMVGPALAGGIIALSNTSVAMWINSFTFFVCALAISLLPNFEDVKNEKREVIKFRIILGDFKIIWSYIRQQRVLLYFLVIYNFTLMIAFALDSQEMTFIKDVLGATDSSYGVIVSVAGIGAIIGGVLATALVDKLSLRTYIGLGFFLSLLGYTIFYASNTLWLATFSFVTLGIFMAFSNTGYATIYQKTIPTPIMGRFGSAINLLQSIVQVLLTFLLGVLAEWFSLQVVSVSFAAIALILATYLYIHISIHKHSLQLD
ncbi:MFS transporter [Lysinibacillus sp. SGAir0095]|uniref:MFS transporter n=1 Tax=Lysinibacillus sp. SGAir0095 TaxID=2070463 RepID=UPI0010CD36C1|nr:MFS transporter [Lysinibacillus sp. SGAir0095]QCR32335.1 MFS transporter [Lysinibacillus sp. SGAir0095]